MRPGLAYAAALRAWWPAIQGPCVYAYPCAWDSVVHHRMAHREKTRGLEWLVVRPHPPRCELGEKNSDRRLHAATNSLRKRHEGPWVWLVYRDLEGRCLFSSHIAAPCCLTFVRRVHSQTFKGGPAILGEWVGCRYSNRSRNVGTRLLWLVGLSKYGTQVQA